MRKMRALAWLLCLALLLAGLSGCERGEPAPVEEEKTELSIYATFYPIYAIASMIAQNVPNLKLNCLVQPQDGCLRDYQLSDWDLALLLGSADAVLAGGRGLESFESLLYALGEDGPAVSGVLYNMDLSSTELKSERKDSHWEGENPNIFLKTDGAMEIAVRIAATLEEIDPKYADVYAKNLEMTKNRLKSLQDEMHENARNLAGQPVILMNEALLYCTEEFDLEIALCIERESGESLYDQAMENCLAQLKASGAQVVFIEKQAPQRFCEDLEAAGYRLARLDTLSTRRADEGFDGYFEAMRANAAAIKAAFAAEGEDGR